MCPAIRFGRFRRLEHQISWPYTGKIGIKTACRHGKSWVVLHSQTPSKRLGQPGPQIPVSRDKYRIEMRRQNEVVADVDLDPF